MLSPLVSEANLRDLFVRIRRFASLTSGLRDISLRRGEA